jgi:hypothetical protein
MNSDNNQPDPPPKDQANRALIWLLTAFAPSLLGIACLHINNPGRWLALVLVFINFLCTLAAGAALVRGMRAGLTRWIAGLFIVPFLFVLNACIVLFVGCSGMGRISP